MTNNIRAMCGLMSRVPVFFGLQLIIMMFFAPFTSIAVAQPCPGGEASLAEVRNVINDLGKNNQAPAAADCGYAWGSSVKLDQDSMADKVLIYFFTEAADLHRQAYRKRKRENLEKSADMYLVSEIALRKRFVEEALKMDIDVTELQLLRRETIKHISALTGALALRKQYLEIDKILSDTRSSVIDNEAIRAWLQAISSCDKFDGNPDINMCVVEKKEDCRERISIFLSFVDDLKRQEFSGRTQKEIANLRRLTEDGGCLNE